MVTRRDLLVGSGAALGVAGAAALGLSPGRSYAATLPAAAVMGFNLPGGLVCPVPYLSRSAWGADESYRYKNGVEDWPDEWAPVQTITVHHTGFVADADPAVTVRGIYQNQAVDSTRGGAKDWGDIGYHLLIDDAGVVYEGRYSGSDGSPIFDPTGSWMVTGAHVGGYNTGNIGVCLLGYLVDTPATAAAQDTLVTVLAYLAAAGRVDPSAQVTYVNPVNGSQKTVTGVSGHRNWAATECPGSAEYGQLGSIRSRVAAALATLPKPTPTQSTAGAPPSAGSGQSTAPVPPSPTAAPKPPAGSSHDKGGDEYVPAARKASPSAYPTKRLAKPSPSVSPSPTPSVEPLPSSFTMPPATSAAPAVVFSSPSPVAHSGDPRWPVPTAAGVVMVGVVGGWLLRRFRANSVPAQPTPASAAEETDAP